MGTRAKRRDASVPAVGSDWSDPGPKAARMGMIGSL
jgi:hypothetical protein